jgi:hypothetical protein
VLAIIGWAAFTVHPDAAGAGAVILTAVVGTTALRGVAYAVATFIRSLDSAGRWKH